MTFVFRVTNRQAEGDASSRAGAGGAGNTARDASIVATHGLGYIVPRVRDSLARTRKRLQDPPEDAQDPPRDASWTR